MMACELKKRSVDEKGISIKLCYPDSFYGLSFKIGYMSVGLPFIMLGTDDGVF